MNKQTITNHPTHLLVGMQNHLIDYVENMLQQQFCLEQDAGAGCFCRQCQTIKKRQHPFIVFINPEKDYTIKDIDVIFEKTRFSLNDNEHFFFVLERVETLTATTANRLLKVLEEPPGGYHFMLLTSNINAVLPTIQSRSLVTTLTSMTDDKSDHPLLNHFYNSQTYDPLGFEQELRNCQLSNSQSIKLLEDAIDHFSEEYKNILKHKNDIQADYLNRVITFLHTQLKKPPQSGSSDIFWKHVYLSFPRK